VGVNAAQLHQRGACAVAVGGGATTRKERYAATGAGDGEKATR